MLIYVLVILCDVVFWWSCDVFLNQLAWAKWGHLGIEAWDELSRKIDVCMVVGMFLSLIGYTAYHLRVQRAVRQWIL